jgi:hypothetical protein
MLIVVAGAVIIVMIIVVVATAAGVIIVGLGIVLLLRGCNGCWVWSASSASFYDFVDLAPVQPDTTALWAVVDLDSLAITHNKFCIVYRTLHIIFLNYVAVLYGVMLVRAKCGWGFLGQTLSYSAASACV